MTSKAFNLKKAQRNLWLFGFFKIPLLGFVSPKLLELSEENALVSIKLRRRTRNHLKSMYFGALCIGADIAGGFHVVALAEHYNLKVSFAFKSFKAQFVKRPEKEVYFICREGKKVADLLMKAQKENTRQNEWVNIEAFVNENGKADTVALFELELSVKVKQ